MFQFYLSNICAMLIKNTPAFSCFERADLNPDKARIAVHLP